MLPYFSLFPTAFFEQCTEVMRLRLAILASDGIYSNESTRMVSEKIAAFTSASLKLATGTFPDIVAKDVQFRVVVNVRRLQEAK